MNYLISCFSLFLVALASQSLSAEQSKAIEIIGPNGKPVEKARIFGVWEDEKEGWGVDEISLADWKQHAGHDIKVFKHRLMVDGKAYEYLMIDAPGCAADVWDTQHFDQPSPLPAQIKLKKEFDCWGTVVDQAGKPISGAEVTYGEFHTGRFADHAIRLMYVAEHFPWVTTKTAKNGSYRLRGITFEGKDLGGVDVLARIKTEDVTMVGHGECLSVKNFAELKEIQKTQTNKYMDGVATLVPCEVITGRIHDPQSGKPIAGARIKYLALQHFDHFDPANDDWLECESDEDGLFSITQIRGINNMHVEAEGRLRVWINSPRKWQGGKPARLDIPLPAMVDVEIKVVDKQTDEAPTVPLKFIYSMKAPLEAEWSLQTYQIGLGKEYMIISKKQLKKGTENVFKARLPVGELDLKCTALKNTEANPYAYEGWLHVAGEQGESLELRLDRKP